MIESDDIIDIETADITGWLKSEMFRMPAWERMWWMDPADIHKSHFIEESDYGTDPHNPSYRCTVCGLASCVMCDTGENTDDDELAAECAGFPVWDAIEVTGDDGITRTVKPCGTGWV